MGRPRKYQNIVQPDEAKLQKSAIMTLIINHGPHFFRENGLIIPVEEKIEVLQEVAERLVTDFKGSRFFNFEIIEA